MRAISQGDNTYDIFDDSLRVYEQLPAQSYVVRFSERRGFYLEKYSDMEIKESKVYGVHETKLKKVMNAFNTMNRNLGVILSGAKGIGKSLFAKMLASESVKAGTPVIVVDTYYSGIASYIESIEQEVMVLFDEFDKTFGEVTSEDGKASPQTHLLSLFDGISSGKKLFVVTCNELRKLNDYLVNRPGRFHYHFRFEYPTSDEIRVYLKDKLNEEHYDEIDNVVAFANKVDINYDCLRAIAFELNTGTGFADAIKDLNIINIEDEYYDVMIKWENGFMSRNRAVMLDMFNNDESKIVELYDNSGSNFADIEFSIADISFDPFTGTHYVNPENVHVIYYKNDDYESVAATKSSKIERVTISRRKAKEIHYTV